MSMILKDTKYIRQMFAEKKEWMTIDEIAKGMKMSTRTIRKALSGMKMRPHTIKLFADALGEKPTAIADFLTYSHD